MKPEWKDNNVLIYLGDRVIGVRISKDEIEEMKEELMDGASFIDIKKDVSINTDHIKYVLYKQEEEKPTSFVSQARF